MRKEILFFLSLASLGAYAQDDAGPKGFGLAKGDQSLGIRFGKGTKNKFDLGFTYNHYLNRKLSLLLELDHEQASFGYSKFTNVFLLSPGVQFMAMNPCRWFGWNLSAGACVGYDKWETAVDNDERSGLEFGGNIGTDLEFRPTPLLAIVLKAQQFYLAGTEAYMKPNFSIGLKFNLNRKDSNE